MPLEDVTITAEFEEILPIAYAVKVDSTITKGTVTANSTSYETGETVTLTVLPDAGYRLKDGTLKFNGNEISGTTFIMPSEDVTVTAEFEKEYSYT